MAKTQIVFGEVGGGSAPTSVSVSNGSITATHSFTLEVGKLYLIEMFNSTNAKYSATQYDGATATNATITKIGNIRTEKDYVFGTYYTLVPTSASVTVTVPSSQVAYVNLFEIS